VIPTDRCNFELVPIKLLFEEASQIIYPTWNEVSRQSCIIFRFSQLVIFEQRRISPQFSIRGSNSFFKFYAFWLRLSLELRFRAKALREIGYASSASPCLSGKIRPLGLVDPDDLHTYAQPPANRSRSNLLQLKSSTSSLKFPFRKSQLDHGRTLIGIF